MPPNPSSSGASAQYTVVAAPCCCGRKEHRDRVEFSGKSKTHQLPSRQRERGSQDTERDRNGQTPGGCVMLSREKKPKLYIYSIYIHIFIYLFLSLPSVYSYSYVGSHKCNRPREEKRQKLKKKKTKKKTSHQLQSGWRKPQLMCLYCESDRFYCHGDEYENARRMYLCVAVCLKYRK